MGDLPPFYDAPEIFKGGYNEKCDLWSTGCLLYILLSGKMPFFSDSQDPKAIADAILIGSYDMDSELWSGVSEDAKDLVRQLLTFESDQRPSAEDALKHPWFTFHYKKGELSKRDLSKSLENISNFEADTKLKQGLIAFFTKYLLTQKERDDLTAQFKAIDANGDGTISREELVVAYKRFKGVDYREEEVDEIIRNIDADGNGVINYSEWILAAVGKERILEKKRLEQAFALFDINGDRKVSY